GAGSAIEWEARPGHGVSHAAGNGARWAGDISRRNAGARAWKSPTSVLRDHSRGQGVAGEEQRRMSPNQEQSDSIPPDELIRHFDQERQMWLHLGDPFSLEMADHLEEALLAFRTDDNQLSSAAFEK